VDEFLEQLLQEGGASNSGRPSRTTNSLEQMFNNPGLRRIAEKQIKAVIVMTTHLTKNRTFAVSPH
jgi:hypothetical protein